MFSCSPLFSQYPPTCFQSSSFVNSFLMGRNQRGVHHSFSFLFLNGFRNSRCSFSNLSFSDAARFKSPFSVPGKHQELKDIRLLSKHVFLGIKFTGPLISGLLRQTKSRNQNLPRPLISGLLRQSVAGSFSCSS